MIEPGPPWVTTCVASRTQASSASYATMPTARQRAWLAPERRRLDDDLVGYLTPLE